MKRVALVHADQTRIFGLTPACVSDAEFAELVRLEFRLRPTDALSVAVPHLDGAAAICPLKQALLDNGATYTLKVYPRAPPSAQQQVCHKREKNDFFFLMFWRQRAVAAVEAMANAAEERVKAAVHGVTRLSALAPEDDANVAVPPPPPPPIDESVVAAVPLVAPVVAAAVVAATPAPAVAASSSSSSSSAGKKEKKNKSSFKSVSSYKPLSAGQVCDPENEAPNWAEYKSDEGHPYWFNSRTGESTWDKPAVLKLGLEKDTNFQAQKYYEDEGYDPFEDDQYFESYTDVGLQGEMVGDRARSDAYLRAMLRFAEHDFKDKVVLDCGCGTGLLSFFAVKAGARKVYAIEGSNLAFTTREVVERNGLGDRIVVYHSRMEDVELPEKVDTIVSEWMGSTLIFESMLGSVLYARDKWLKPGGMLYPSRATIYFGPIEAKEFFEKKIHFWNDVYGFNMTPFLKTARAGAVEKPMFDRIVEADDVLCRPDEALELVHYDLLTMSVDEIERVAKPYRFVARRDGTLHGFSCWFTTDFESSAMRAAHHQQRPTAVLPITGAAAANASIADSDAESKVERTARRTTVKAMIQKADDASHAALLRGEVGDADEVVTLSTAPNETPTHWKQLSMLFDDGVPVREGDEIKGEIDIQRNTYWRRHFNFDLVCSVNGSEPLVKAFGLWRYKTVQAPKPENVPKGAL